MIYTFEDFSFDTDRQELLRGKDRIAIEPQVFDLLHYLFRNRDRVVSKDDLIAAVWKGRIIGVHPYQQNYRRSPCHCGSR